MAKLDLRALSAPLEALRSDVKAAYSRLDSKWDEIITQLRKLPIPDNVKYTYGTDPDSGDSYALEFRKHKGEKRICAVFYSYTEDEYGTGSIASVAPYEEWGADQRIEMLEHIPALFAEAVKVTKAFINKIPE